MVVAGSEVDGGGGPAGERGGGFPIAAEEGLDRVGEGLRLHQIRAGKLARVLHGPVRGCRDRVGLRGKRPCLRAERPGEEGIEGRPRPRVRLDRVGEVHVVAPHDGANEPLLPPRDAHPRCMKHDPGEEAARVHVLERDGEGQVHVILVPFPCRGRESVDRISQPEGRDPYPRDTGPARCGRPGAARSAVARSSRLSRLCTGRNSSTWGRRARIPAAFGSNPS